MYLPRNATIEESCEWMEAKTGERWTLPRLLEEAHLTPHVWIDHIPGYPQIFGERLEGYLTKMIFHGDVMRLAADRADALITMFPAHDGSLIKVSPGWRVALKDVRFNGQALERVAEIINGAKTAPAQSPEAPEPVVPVPKPARATRRTWWEVASPYMAQVLKNGQFSTAKELYRALESKAGPDSPFDAGTGAHRGSLFVRDVALPLALKTVQNRFNDLRKLAQASTP